ncbi:ATP-dependent DNA helicase RecG [Fundicoccus culcitae]|uniref:ATP-dependent DNA helicase RecG n=1 Tax=Fundicoccus culcitae TaxID=2969821 RepID=A0ABY5P5R2_9LACT|nr:ATP-dependent DNA helicase RecG [Fundicoccus culcitae]UUX34091.1 ATP-dependent DNA helicase RecG [Fundicoccus culcitae]
MESSWDDLIDDLPGIGPKRLALFHQLDIYSIKDLLFHFPFRFENIQERDLMTIFDQEKVTLKGKVVTPPVVNYFGRNKSRLSFRFAVGDFDVIQVTFFNQPYLKQQLEMGQERAIYGKWESDKQALLGMKLLPNQKEGNDLLGVYSTTQGLKQATIVNTIKAAFESYYTVIPEILPEYLNNKYRLIPLNQALYQLHFPKNTAEQTQAKRKIIFQEFFLYQWRLQNAKHYSLKQKGKEMHYEVEELKSWIQRLPYELTDAQKQSMNEICYDLIAPYPMRRLLQGEVGSGKTIIAFLAMITTAISGYQSALIVPTEILAHQHVEKFKSLFEAYGLRVELLISVMPTQKKQAVIDDLASGKLQFVIGTHAILQESVTFARLGLIIIDEQHRFGVQQRQQLIDRNSQEASVNLLQMTATPIPRSLAQSLYGDMQVSTIAQLPKGRKPIETRWFDADKLDEVYQQMRSQISQGFQVYYVLPLIQNSEALESVENVMQTVATLKTVFPEYKIDALHGQLDKASQQQVMEAFNENELQILVATTMVEVGVDVPNATMMIIQSAERFGLAQLHQLRGRVGRGAAQSYCYLIANPTTEQGKERLQIMVESQDGFYISQADLKIRGMGNLLGREQSGIPQFHYANLIEDQTILNVAQNEVNTLLKNPHLVEDSEWKTLNKYTIDQKMEA